MRAIEVAAVGAFAIILLYWIGVASTAIHYNNSFVVDKVRLDYLWQIGREWKM